MNNRPPPPSHLQSDMNPQTCADNSLEDDPTSALRPSFGAEFANFSSGPKRGGQPSPLVQPTPAFPLISRLLLSNECFVDPSLRSMPYISSYFHKELILK